MSDRPLAAYHTNRAIARARQASARERHRTPREQSGYRGPGRRAIDVGA